MNIHNILTDFPIFFCSHGHIGLLYSFLLNCSPYYKITFLTPGDIVHSEAHFDLFIVESLSFSFLSVMIDTANLLKSDCFVPTQSEHFCLHFFPLKIYSETRGCCLEIAPLFYWFKIC